MSSSGRVLSVVERGWRGARECSIVLSAGVVPVTHLVKGYLRPSLRRALIRPYPHVRVVSVPRWLFRPFLWGTVVWSTLAGRLRWILLDHERTERELAPWCRWFRIVPVRVQEHDEDYTLFVHEQPVTVVRLFGVAGA